MEVDILQDGQGGCEKACCTFVVQMQTLPCVPVNQYDADSKEGDGRGEEIGGGYAVRHHLRLTDQPVVTGAGAGVCARCDDGIRVVAIEQ